jgi:dTDP-4-dehydrorhamnose reductase
LRILVTGAGGLVGHNVVSYSQMQGDVCFAHNHRDLDITDQSAVNATLERERPNVVINCAACTDVDGCESDPQRAHDANARGPELLALGCRQINAQLITISTDYVFDGNKEGFYTQRDQPNPLSVYGASKLEGERRAQNAWARTVIVRSGYIFGSGGKNFLSTVVARARRGEQLSVITDSFGTPTYAPDLAQRLCRLAELDLPGTFHVVSSGEGASFEDFARLAFTVADLDQNMLRLVKLADLDRPAPRPRNSRLRCLLSEAVGLEPLPSWQDALDEFIAE